ncbi:MAG: polysaccharide biosynthesis C-terminal domain-containing protein [Pseudomonadota bacterium]
MAEGHSDARALAGGSTWVFLGSMFEGALRLVTSWYLSGALMAENYGAYTFVVTAVTLASLAAPFGADMGILYFGARWAQAKDRARRKGYLLTGLGVVMVTGPAFALVLAALGWSGHFWQDRPGVSRAMVLVAPTVAIMALLIYFTWAIRSAKDMLRSTLIFQVVVPAVLLVGSVVALRQGTELRGVIVAFMAANAIAAVMAAGGAWKHFGALLRDRAVKPIFEPRVMLGYAIPQSIPVVIYRLNIWMDILMLFWLGTAEQTGIYRVAVGIVGMVIFPVGAVNTMFSPQVTQLFHAGEMGRLDALLKVATRWLVILVTPFYMVVVLEHRLILSAFAPEYMASASVVLILIAGQAVHAVCAPANRLLPMSGRSVLDMGISLAAVALNLTLNYLLIPRFGGVGAAISGATTFSAWGISRVFVAWVLTGCHPFTPRLGVLTVGALGFGGAAMLLAPEGRLAHLAVSTIALGAFAVLAFTAGRTVEDAALIQAAWKRLRRMLGRDSVA